jgi:hypothetical protein
MCASLPQFQTASQQRHGSRRGRTTRSYQEGMDQGPKARASGYATLTRYPSLSEHALLVRSSGIAD